MEKKKVEMVAVVGPTAVGKTVVAVRLAKRLDGEIISADSRQVYRGMSIGTGKDLADYVVDGENVPYHLIDIVDAGYKYNVFEYQQDFSEAYNNVRLRRKLPVLCGGTGMYIEAVVNGYRLNAVPPDQKLRLELEEKTDAELIGMLESLKALHNKSDIDTRKRAIRAIEIALYYQQNPGQTAAYAPIPTCYIGIEVAVEERRSRITRRLYQRLDEGMVDEVKGLLARGISSENLCYYGLEYKLITQYLTGQLSYNDMVSKLNIAIHQFAKRQMTWFRGMERKGTVIHWVDGMLPMDAKQRRIDEILKGYELNK